MSVVKTMICPCTPYSIYLVPCAGKLVIKTKIINLPLLIEDENIPFLFTFYKHPNVKESSNSTPVVG